MQKLVTVYLDNLSYVQGKWRKAAHGDHHGLVEEHLEEYISQGWKITDEYIDGGYSGGTDDRPALKRLLADAKQHRFNVIAVG